MTTLASLSEDLAAAVARAGRATVAVRARPRLPSTGVHWRSGSIVTADHTIRVEEEIVVTWSDGATSRATVAGRDAGTDLAVLRVEDGGRPVVEFGEPVMPEVGHLVLAVGYGPRASFGVVSGLEGPRRAGRGGPVDPFLRLDLVLYPGFSGGPLVDARGRVAGIVTSGLARQLELAIPAATVARVVDELLATGRVRRGYLGLGMQPVRLPEPLRGAGRDRGLIVVHAEPGGPAASAGVLLGDVLVSLDGAPVGDHEDVQTVLADRSVGSAITLTVIRAGNPLEIRATIGERSVSR
jgi:S1-C subfamily serine protease